MVQPPRFDPCAERPFAKVSSVYLACSTPAALSPFNLYKLQKWCAVVSAILLLAACKALTHTLICFSNDGNYLAATLLLAACKVP